MSTAAKKTWHKSAEVILMIAAVLAFASCRKNDDNSPSSPGTVTNTVQQGAWRISNFNDNGNNETSHFNGYTFTFFSGGTITAVNGTNTFNGTWTSQYDDSHDKLLLNFGSASLFEELNEDWHVLEQNNSLIRLEHMSGGNGGTDHLDFEKI